MGYMGKCVTKRNKSKTKRKQMKGGFGGEKLTLIKKQDLKEVEGDLI